MPSLKDSAVRLDGERYQPARQGPDAYPAPMPVTPQYLSQSTVMISSLPSIVTNADGIIRQFYGTNLPARRLILPA